MALLVLGNQFEQDLEKHGALAVWVPPEGGHEGRYQRRLKGAGYRTLHMTARGMGELEAYLTRFHGVRPPHLGKALAQTAAVGDVYYFPPLLDQALAALPPQAKGVVLWLIEGKVLARQELRYLTVVPTQYPRCKVVVEVASGREFRWQPLTSYLEQG
ncbi:MAG: NAD(P)H-quinone oxidoreductase subunit N [Gloeomargarita sp. GMQP_bins_120]